MKDDNKELLELVKENNLMLKEIIRYINYVNKNVNNENANDFGMNVMANLLSSKLLKL